MEAFTETLKRNVGFLPSFLDGPNGRIFLGARPPGPTLWTPNNIIGAGLVGLWLVSALRPAPIKTKADDALPTVAREPREARVQLGADRDLIGREAQAPHADLVHPPSTPIFTREMLRSGFKAPSLTAHKARVEDLKPPPRRVSEIHQFLGVDYAHDTLPKQDRR
jgi:hypothetical protein